MGDVGEDINMSSGDSHAAPFDVRSDEIVCGISVFETFFFFFFPCTITLTSSVTEVSPKGNDSELSN